MDKVRCTVYTSVVELNTFYLDLDPETCPNLNQVPDPSPYKDPDPNPSLFTQLYIVCCTVLYTVLSTLKKNMTNICFHHFFTKIFKNL